MDTFALGDAARTFVATFIGLPATKVAVVYAFAFAVLPPLYKKFTAPLSLRTVMILFNIGLCVANCWVTAQLVVGLAKGGNITDVEISNPSLQPALQLYSMLKYVELLDTLFMLLRHKFRQISFLHVFHHASMTILGNFISLYAIWPAIAFVVAMNAFVHIPMYLYYGLAAIGPAYRPADKWKVRMTTIQMIQFVVGIFHGAYGYMFKGFCIYACLYGGTMLLLFSNFFISTCVVLLIPARDLHHCMSFQEREPTIDIRGYIF